MLLSRTGYSGKRFIFEKCHELGVKAVVLDAPDSWAQLMEKEGIISKFIPIDFADAEHAFDNCLKVFWGGGQGGYERGGWWQGRRGGWQTEGVLWDSSGSSISRKPEFASGGRVRAGCLGR